MKKLFLTICVLFFLNGCIQPTALLGPSLTVAASGNIYKAGLQYGSNKIIEKSTGKTTSEHARSILENHQNKKNKKSLNKLVNQHIQKARTDYFNN